jgi:hypothetical protein
MRVRNVLYAEVKLSQLKVKKNMRPASPAEGRGRLPQRYDDDRASPVQARAVNSKFGYTSASPPAAAAAAYVRVSVEGAAGADAEAIGELGNPPARSSDG